MCSSRTSLSQLQHSKINLCTRYNYSSIEKTRKVDKVQNNLRLPFMTPSTFDPYGHTYVRNSMNFSEMSKRGFTTDIIMLTPLIFLRDIFLR